MYLHIISISIILFFTSSIASAASFNCNNAATKVEKLICSDKQLTYLDEALGKTYKSLKASNNVDLNKILKSKQREWIQVRNTQCKTLEGCKKVYPIRISELRTELESRVTLNSFTIDRQSCRASKDQEVLIKCVNQMVYDPCDDSGGKWGAAQCGWVHTEIANRKIKAIEKQIIETIKISKSHNDALNSFNSDIEAWNSYLSKHCNFTNTVDDLENFSSMHLHLAFCKRRMSEQRVVELENVLSRSYSLN